MGSAYIWGPAGRNASIRRVKFNKEKNRQVRLLNFRRIAMMNKLFIQMEI